MSSSIIKSDNGVSSGVTGIVQTAGSDGTLLLQTTTAGGVATTALTINNTQGVTLASTLSFAASAGINGINFNNNTSGVQTESLLNDYETGSWTPTVLPGSGSLTSYTSSGTYTKIGNLVNIVAFFRITSAGTSGGGGSITNVPFASTNVDASYQPNTVMRETGATGVFYALYFNNNSTTINFQNLTGGPLVWTNNYCYAFTLTYKTTF